MSEQRIAIEHLPDAVLVVSREGVITEANVHAERLFGYGPGKLKGMVVEALIPDRFRDPHVDLRSGFFAAPAVRHMGSDREVLAVKADGTEFPVEIALGTTGDGTAAVALVRDITAIVQNRNDLEASERRFRVVAESTADLIWEGEAATDTLIWYGDIDTLLGYEPGAFPQTVSGWLQHLHPDDAEAVTQSIEESIETGVYGSPDYRIRHKDGTWRYWQDRGTVTEFDGRKGRRAVGAITDVTERVLARQELERALAEVALLKDRLQAESTYLQSEIASEHNFEEIVGNSGPTMATLKKVGLVAETDSTVLLFGETGTGKELLARAIHARGPRRRRPLIKVDCNTLSPGLIESELFGHEKGAFTGAHRDKVGRFELADGGTIFLDEIGELPLDLQSKLLNVLEDGVFQPVGSSRELRVDVRVIAATNRELKREITEGRFRSDLYYRLGVFIIEAPPLRQRREDIPLLVSYFVTRFAAAQGKRIRSVADASLEALTAYDWPGNVRELKNVVERSVILCSSETLVIHEELEAAALSPSGDPDKSLKRDLRGVERDRILEALAQSGWKIKGAGNAADRLGLKPSTLRSRMQRLGIERP